MSLSSVISVIRQCFPGKPQFTGKNVPDLTDKVVVITGANTGIGKEIAQIAYSKNAKVYIFARSEDKAIKAIDDIKAAVPKSAGELKYIHLNLADLTSIKPTVEEFLRKEEKLDILFNNAGVGYPEKGLTTKQGYELQLGVNCVGTFALTKLLTPILVSTAKTAPPDSVRVIWASSSAAEGMNPKGFMKNVYNVEKIGAAEKYFTSKLGGYLYSAEFANLHKADGVLSVSLNPGNLDSDLWRYQRPFVRWFLRKTVLFPVIYGAYTCIFAGFSSQVTLEKTGQHIAPWGKFWNMSKGFVAATKTKSEGGTGAAQEFWKWSNAQVAKYL
ncbi:NAD(P)-binding protein [Hypoxylon trugodes]|uniref:NAD(P)-binding protein n=1 Tax=Hypoxylon trugodes TaxID=326681 RepID=UPI002195A142|nr:NAD(P)-binding protein [Hypoxylon trugodes]KAI1388439.1 NAD(P)-binding protein [Hypoxylon trugodes]